MRGAWAVAFVAGCACGLVAGRLLPREETGRALPRVVPARVAESAPGSVPAASEDAALSPAEDRRAPGRARRDASGAETPVESVAARIGRLTPDGPADPFLTSIGLSPLVAVLAHAIDAE